MHRQLLLCHDGQGLDLTARMNQLEQSKIADLVLTSTRLKTGSLMKLAAVLGAIAAGASAKHVAHLATFGEHLGIGLQMLDDVGGLLSEARCHKGHEDLRLGRPTWPWAWLSCALPAERFETLRRASAEVCAGDLHPEVLARALRQALQGSGRVRVRHYLHSAFAQLQSQLGPSPALQQLEAELRRMERSYG
jgi:geranylgeranyl pyrophosphate synthase